jgi:hypothetical protein
MFLLKIIIFDVDVSDFHDYFEYAICHSKEIPRTVKTAEAKRGFSVMNNICSDKVALS